MLIRALDQSKTLGAALGWVGLIGLKKNADAISDPLENLKQNHEFKEEVSG